MEQISPIESLLGDLDKELAVLDAHLSGLANEETQLAKLGEQERQLLAFELSEEQKVKKLVELRARADVKRANIAKERANIAVAEEKCALAGETVGYEIGAYAQAALAQRERKLVEAVTPYVREDDIKGILIPHSALHAISKTLQSYCHFHFGRTEVTARDGKMLINSYADAVDLCRKLRNIGQVIQDVVA